MTMRADWVWTQYKRLPPFTWLGKLDWEYCDIEDAGQADNGSGDADRITPDPAGDYVDDAVTLDDSELTADWMQHTPWWRPLPASTSPYTPRILWRFKMAMMVRYGRYSAQAKRAFALFDSIYPQYA